MYFTSVQCMTFDSHTEQATTNAINVENSGYTRQILYHPEGRGV